MKKIVGLLLVLASVFLLVGCKGDDQKTLDEAYDRLLHPWEGTQNAVINSKSVMTVGYGGTAIAWESSNTDVAAIEESAEPNMVLIEITRPAEDAEDVSLILTATISIGDLSREKEFTLTVLKFEQADAYTVEQLRDPAITVDTPIKALDVVVVDVNGAGYVIGDATQATILVFGSTDGISIGLKGDINGKKGAYYDGPQIIEATFSPRDHDFDYVPEEEDLSYFGLWDLMATPTTQIEGYAAALKAKKTDPALSHAVKVRGTLFQASGVTGTPWAGENNPDRQLYLTDDPANPSDIARIHYDSAIFDEISLLSGTEVIMTAVAYSIRDDYETLAIVSKTIPIWYIFAISYEPATPLTDEQKVELDKNALSVPSLVEENSTLTLPTSGAKGSTISWASSDSAVVNPTTGVVTVPAEGTVEVTLTATITSGTASDTATFVVTVGEVVLVDMAGLLGLADGAEAVSEAEVLFVSGKNAIVGDETGYGYVYNYADAANLLVGNMYRFFYTVDIYNGLIEMTGVTVGDATGTNPNLNPEPEVWTATEVNAFMELDAWSPVLVTANLLGYASGNYTNGLMENFDGDVQTNNAPEGARDHMFTITSWITGRRPAGPTFGVAAAADYVISPDPLPAATSVVIGEVESTELLVGDELELSATKAPWNAGTILWKTSNAAIATVDSKGVVTAVSEGTATITAYIGATEDTLDVTVSVPEGPVLAVVYETGFESSEGFAAGTTYNNDTALNVGADGKQWSVLHGTPTATGSAVIEGSQSLQMRSYAPSTNPANDHSGHELSATTLFTFSAIDQIEFTLKGNVAGLSLVVSYSADGTTWTEIEVLAIISGTTDVVIELDETLENVYLKLQVLDDGVSPAIASQVTIDGFVVKAYPAE